MPDTPPASDLVPGARHPLWWVGLVLVVVGAAVVLYWLALGLVLQMVVPERFLALVIIAWGVLMAVSHRLRPRPLTPASYGAAR